MFNSPGARRGKVGKEEVLLGKAAEETKQLSLLRKLCHSLLTLQPEPTSAGNTWVIHHLPRQRAIKYPELEGTHKECPVQLLALHGTPKIPTTCLRALSRLSLNSGRLGSLGGVPSLAVTATDLSLQEHSEQISFFTLIQLIKTQKQL